MENIQYDNLKRDIKTLSQSKPVKFVLLIGSALVTLMLVAGVFRVLSIFFQSYNTMKTAYYGK